MADLVKALRTTPETIKRAASAAGVPYYPRLPWTRNQVKLILVQFYAAKGR